MKIFEKPNYEKFQVLEVKEKGFKERVSFTIDTNKMPRSYPYEVIKSYAEKNILVVVKIGFNYYSLITTE